MAIGLLLLLAMTPRAEAKTLEQVSREIRAYWAQQRFEAQQRVEERIQQQQLDALRDIERNTRRP
jgi:hypothetical protein